MAMLYTTHRMEEIQTRGPGARAARRPARPRPAARAHDAGRHRLRHDRTGPRALFPVVAPPQDTVGLAVRGLQLQTGGPTVDLEVRPGEILDVGGLVRAGRTEVAEATFGIRRSVGGEITVDARSVKCGNPVEAIRAGIILVPEDRKGVGLVLSQPILDNGSLPRLSPSRWPAGSRARPGATRCPERPKPRNSSPAASRSPSARCPEGTSRRSSSPGG